VAQRFEAVLEKRGAGTLVEIPLDVPAVFGGKRVPVRGTVNGSPFTTTIATYGGRYYLGFRREIREAAGVAAGDPVVVELERDDEPRTVELPDDLAAALDSETRASFDRLSYTHRKEYVRWVKGAKRDETRRKRVAQAVELLRAGVETPG
jgi:hypothetical protein